MEILKSTREHLYQPYRVILWYAVHRDIMQMDLVLPGERRFSPGHFLKVIHGLN